jgi:serine/threonine protein kinase
MPAHLDVAGLGPLTRLASGGQGEVFAAPRLRMRYASSLVFKQYKPAVAGSLDVPVLESMPAYLESLPFAEGMELLAQAAWPCRLVDDAGRVAGFVMPAIPDAFFVQMRKSSGMSREAAEFQHLLNDDSFLARRQIGLSDRRRYELLREVAGALSVFHRHGIAVGDLSPKNLLFAFDPDPGVYFIDCDAMRFQTRSVMRQLETPGWEVRAVSPHEELATSASDSYKLGLLALRLLAGSQDARDPVRLPRTVPAGVRQLVTAGLSADPARRPRPADWITPLDTAAATASTTTPQLPKPALATPTATSTSSPAPTARAQFGATAPTLAPSPASSPAPRAFPPSRSVARGYHGSGSRGSRMTPLRLGLLAVAAVGVVILLIVTLTGLDGSAAHAPGSHDFSVPASRGVLALAVSDNGDALIADGYGKTSAGLWDANANRRILTLPDPSGAEVYAESFSPDGRVLVTGDARGNTYFWNAATGKNVRRFSEPSAGNGITSLAFSEDGNFLAAVDANGTAYSWNMATGALTTFPADPKNGGSMEVTISRGGKVLATGDGYGHIHVWDVAKRTEIRSFEDPGGLGFFDLSISPGGKLLAGSDAVGDSYLWNTATGKLVSTMTHATGNPGPEAVEFSPNGRMLIIGDSATGNILAWNIAADKMQATLAEQGGSGGYVLAFSPDEKMVAAVAGPDGSVTVRAWSRVP